MALAIESVVPSRLPTWVRKRPFMVVFLGDGVSVERPRMVVQGFDKLFPEQVGVGWMSRDSVASQDWWERHWRTELGPFRRGAPPPAGTYLFHLGYVVGHHPGTAVHGGRETWLAVRSYLIERMRLKASAGGDETEWVRTDGSRRTGGRPRSEPPPPPPRRARPPEGPYELLEVAADAPDDAVRRAYRTALKLNHPDRVASLSRQIQEFARERTQLIVAAWEAIKEERGIR